MFRFSLLWLLLAAGSLWADFSSTATLTSGAYLNLETGATASAGADLLWTGTALDPQGKARIGKLPANGTLFYNTQNQATLGGLSILASTATIQAANMPVNTVLIIVTNNGNYAKALVTTQAGGTLSLQYTTYGVAAVPGTPVVTGVLNNSSRIAPGLPNYGIAPSSLFVVTGSSLADDAPLVLQDSSKGLPTTLNGASITITAGGLTIKPPLYYTSPTQLAAVLPANAPIGSATLKVTRGTLTSEPITFQIVAAALGFNTYDVAVDVATDAVTGSVLTYTNSGTPGQTIVLWATGLGADPGDSDTTFATSPHAVNTPLKIYIGGMPATILYAGSSGYPGVNQINVVIPPGSPQGCWVPIVAITNGTTVSNVAVLPINRGGGSCSDPATGLTGTQIYSGSAVNYRTGFVSVGMATSTDANNKQTVSAGTSAAFQKYESIFYSSANIVSPGACIIATPATVTGMTGLDPGKISLTGPNGLSVTLANTLGIKGAFSAQLDPSVLPATGGTFTFTGSGGTDVGPFTATVKVASSLLNWTNQTAARSIDKTKDLILTWTGGTPGSYVEITGSSTVHDRATATTVVAEFECLAPAEAGQFTVPSYILLALPDGNGGVLMQNTIQSSLTASGLDIASALGYNQYSVTSTYHTGAALTK